MHTIPRRLLTLVALLLLPLAWWGCQTVRQPGPSDLETVLATASLPTGTTNTPTITPYAGESWITIDLPADASQLEKGAEIYRLVCSACHAYDGSGLTDEWRATWNEKDQNCWQSKCHAENHPPDGFYLPYSPPITGPILPAMFADAQELYAYNQEYMPWHNPNRMTPEEVYAVTAHVLALNGIDPGPYLDAVSAPQIRLRP